MNITGRKILFVGGFVTSVFLMGCSTHYQSAGLTGGYSETTTAPDSFIVTFSGNGYTSSEKVVRYADLAPILGPT